MKQKDEKNIEELMKDYLYDETNTISIEEAKNRLNKKYPFSDV